MKRSPLSLLAAAALSFLLPCLPLQAEAQQISSDPAGSIQWSLDPADLHVDGLDALSILSVSPTGHYIAAADRSVVDPQNRNAAGIPNPLGRFPDAIYLFAKDADKDADKDAKHYHLSAEIPVDTKTQLELSSILGGGCEFAWNYDETRIIISSAWGKASELMSLMMITHTNLYLLELNDGTFQRLTENDENFEHSIKPKWTGEDTICYAQMNMTDDNLWQNTLCELDVNTGEEITSTSLYCAEGRVCPVLSWQILDEQIYYTVDAMAAQTGFFKSPVGGKGDADAKCLIDLTAELRETGAHPYCRSMELYDPAISADGKWACLSLNDQRVVNRDIPLSDDPQNPQSDPANAVSNVTKQPWTPCHNILLYNLDAEQLADPFTDEALSPTKVIVTGACFSPDGKSLLCAVFGDGGPWTISDFTRTTFYQIDLSSADFTAKRLFETELSSSMWFPSGFRWLDGNILCIPVGMPPLNLVQMFQIAADIL